MVMGVDDALIAAAIAATASVAGSVMSNQTAAGNAAAGNFASFQIADANRRDAHAQWQGNRDLALYMDARNKEYATAMSNTAYQRAVADMRAAGINPMLAYQQGGATSTPVSGSAPSSTTASSSQYQHQMPRIQNVLGGATSSAVQAAQVVQNIRQSTATIDNTQQLTQQSRAQEEQLRAQSRLTDTQTALTAAQEMTEQERTRFTRAQEALARANEAESAQRTRTETERTYLTHQQGGTELERRRQAENESRRQRDWGVAPNPTAAALAAAEAAARRADAATRGTVLNPTQESNPLWQNLQRLFR